MVSFDVPLRPARRSISSAGHWTRLPSDLTALFDHRTALFDHRTPLFDDRTALFDDRTALFEPPPAPFGERTVVSRHRAASVQ
jgi:hypothetical protein